MSLMTQDAGKAATIGLDPEVTVHNRLPEGHRYRRALDPALRSRLRELSGRWELSVHAVGRILIQIDVLAPGGSRWSLAVPVPEGPQAEDIVEAVWAGCARLAESQRLVPQSVIRDAPADLAGTHQGSGGNRA